ncbi:hypothetical protein F3J13_33550, partial [Burkholderia sp. Tr-849]|nr:hypothetical protein [Burkholderia sp. Tr-849]
MAVPTIDAAAARPERHRPQNNPSNQRRIRPDPAVPALFLTNADAGDAANRAMPDACAPPAAGPAAAV